MVGGDFSQTGRDAFIYLAAFYDAVPDRRPAGTKSRLCVVQESSILTIPVYL